MPAMYDENGKKVYIRNGVVEIVTDFYRKLYSRVNKGRGGYTNFIYSILKINRVKPQVIVISKILKKLFQFNISVDSEYAEKLSSWNTLTH